jgi:trimeric autotransporter adhesin
MTNKIFRLKRTPPRVSNLLGRLLFRRAFLLTPLVFALFALSPAAQAVDPPPDGGYPNQNTAEGEGALFSLDTSQGTGNTAIGFDALYSNTTGNHNTAIGLNALTFNTTGYDNDAFGTDALYSNTTGVFNTAFGSFSLYGNTTGNYNTATGSGALEDNRTGGGNTATGWGALSGNRTGSENTAIGYQALFFNVHGEDNTATGSGALFLNRFGNSNTATGRNALYNNRNGASNIALGDNAGFNVTGSQNIDIGNNGVGGESATIRIGGTQTNTYIAGISGVSVASGIGVIVDSNGHLGTSTSSARYKENIQPMDKASEAILSLQPVTFRYKKELDPKAILQFGLVAEQVEKVNRDLVARDEQGKPYTVRYEAVNAMLLNEFLKEHHKVQELEANAARQQKQIEALTAGLQKVSAQVRLNGAAPQMVVNNQ